jgi:glycine/D-amino acid oxidase-like deaminating enzyme
LKEGPGSVTVKIAAGSVTAKDVIVSTYAPFNNPRISKYKKGVYNSYVFEIRVPEGIFTEGLYWDAESPYHYFRIDRRGTFDRMILGGEDHRSELPVSQKKFDALEKYLEPAGGLPLIGAYKPHQFVATAFSGNGMTYAMVSALIFRDLILGQKNPWIHIFDRNLRQHRNTSNPRRKQKSSSKK